MSSISFNSLLLTADIVGSWRDTASCPPLIIGDKSAEEVEVEVEVEVESEVEVEVEKGAEEGWRLCVGTVRALPLVIFSIS